MSDNEFDSADEAIAFIRDNTDKAIKRFPGVDQIILEVKSGSSRDDVRVALARLGVDRVRGQGSPLVIDGEDNRPPAQLIA